MNLNKITLSDILQCFHDHSFNFKSNININEKFNNLNTIKDSKANDITFLSNEKYLSDLKNTKAKACIINEKFLSYLPDTCSPIIVDNPYLAMSYISNIFDNNNLSNGIISKNCFIDKGAKLYENIQIDNYSVISNNTLLKKNIKIGSNTKIGPNVIINNNCLIEDNVTITNALIDENCHIKSGARIGGSGFGFEEKSKSKISHHGTVHINKNCSIGSNTTIDRAVFEKTIIGEYSQIDNLVQIAHNVEIGKHAIIAAQVGIAGSTIIGDHVKIGGQAGISGHLNIGKNVVIAAKSGVTKNIENFKVVAGFPAKDIKLWKKEIIKLNKIL